MELSKHRFWHPEFFSGGQSSGRGRPSRIGQSGQSSFIFSSLPCLAISFPDFLSFATAWSTRFISRHRTGLGFLLSRISSVPVH